MTTAEQVHALTTITYVSAAIFWLAAAITIRACTVAPKPPRALIEAAAGAVLLALFITIYAVLFWNTDNGYPLFSTDTARVIARLAPVLLVARPILFIVVFAVNGFRDREQGVESYREAGRRLSR